MKLVVLALALSLLSLRTYALPIDGQDRGNGGDLCEMRINEIRMDLKNWIGKGGASKLELPRKVGVEQYKKAMLEQISKATVICTQDIPTIEGVEKTCVNFVNAQGSNIRCNYDRLLNAPAEDQYVLIHHEYAGLAKFEINSGVSSDYSISNQIFRFLRSGPSTHLDINPNKGCDKNSVLTDAEQLAIAIYESNVRCIKSLADEMGAVRLNKMIPLRKVQYIDWGPAKLNLLALPPLTFAAALGRVEAMGVLLQHGAEVNIDYSETGYYPTSIAAKTGQVEAIKLLAKAHGSVNYPSFQRYNPVGAALSNLNDKSYPVARVYSTVEALLDLGADPNDDSFDKLFLSVAAEADQFNIVDLLIKYGASPTQKEPTNSTPIFHCRSKACVDKFVGLGVDVNATDLYNRRAIDMVETEEAVKALLSHGSTPRILKTADGQLMSRSQK